MMRGNKTDALQNTLFEAILKGHYVAGDKLPTEREFAELTGTSRITVRRAYSRLEEAGVLERHQGRGTFVSRVRPRGNPDKAEHVALLASVRDPFAMEFICALEKQLVDKSTLFVLRLTEEDPVQEEKAAMDLVGRGIRNIVIWPSGTGFPTETFSRLRLLGCNMVFFDRMLPGNYADYVGLDNRHAVEALLEHARESGKRHFVFVSHEGLDADSDQQREEAFDRYCVHEGLSHKLARVPWHGDGEAVLRRNKDKWFFKVSKTAAICVNDDVAIQVHACVGGAINVYGIDGLPEAISAGIPSVRQPMEEMAVAAIRLLHEQQEKADGWRARCLYFKGILTCPYRERAGKRGPLKRKAG